MSILRTTLSKAPWTSTEDKILCEVMMSRGDKIQWKDVANELNTRYKGEVLRTGKQCRERWTNHLDPSVNRGAWTDDEDIKLLQYLLEHGKKWSEISRLMANRTENAVKNRWKSIMRKYEKDSRFTKAGGDWETQVARFVLNELLSTAGSRSNQGGMEIQTKRSDRMEADSESLEQTLASKSSLPKKPTQVGKKKNLLMGIVREETPIGFTPMNDHSPSNNLTNVPTNANMYGFGRDSWQHHQQQFGGFSAQFGQNSQQQQNTYSQPQEHNPLGMFSPYNPPQGSFGGSNYGMSPGLANPFFQTSHSNQFSDPFAGLPSLTNQNSVVSNNPEMPLNSVNILSMTPGSFPRSSPSLLRNATNPFLTNPTFPLDANPYQNSKQGGQNASGNENESNLMQRDFMCEPDIKTPESMFPVKASRGIKRELIEKSISEFNTDLFMKLNSNKQMFAIIDYENKKLYPINSVNYENYKAVMNTAKFNVGNNSLFASPLNKSTNFKSSAVMDGSKMELDTPKSNADLSSLSLGKSRMVPESPSQQYFDSLLYGTKPSGSPDSFLSLRSPTLLGGSLGRRPSRGRMML